MAQTSEWNGTGRRKTAVARVRIKPGTGTMVVNRLSPDDYFHRDVLLAILKQPLEITDTADKFDIFVNVDGGGKAGQAGAVRHGITRALLDFDDTLRPPLKRAGLITRDARSKERKKYGQKGARARFQFSKR